MKVTDSLINNILKKMGVNPNEPPHWKPYFHKVKDQRTGEVIDEIFSGYMCSYCGKVEHYQPKECSGCNSIMIKWSDNNV